MIFFISRYIKRYIHAIIPFLFKAFIPLPVSTNSTPQLPPANEVLQEDKLGDNKGISKCLSESGSKADGDCKSNARLSCQVTQQSFCN